MTDESNKIYQQQYDAIIEKMTLSYGSQFMEDQEKLLDFISKSVALRYLLKLCYNKFVSRKDLVPMEEIDPVIKENLWKHSYDLVKDNQYTQDVNYVRKDICKCIYFLSSLM